MPARSPRSILFFSFLLLGGAASLRAASQEQEYQQVRTIALRDARVRAAYEEADQRLAAKIVQIDPALAGYARGHHREAAEPSAPLHQFRAAPPSKSHPSPAAVPAAPHVAGRTHTVVKGDTLSSIARTYGVSVAALKAANGDQDEKHLPIGQVLAIPSGHAPQAAPAETYH